MDDYKIIVEQQRVVSILDTFEASIQNLEAQLVQREKQYEYYRNKLLTFELLLQILGEKCCYIENIIVFLQKK